MRKIVELHYKAVDGVSLRKYKNHHFSVKDKIVE